MFGYVSIADARSAGGALGAALRQFVRDARRGDVLSAMDLCREGRQGSLNLPPHTAHGDSEHSLAPADQVNDLVSASALVNARAVAHQGDVREVLPLSSGEMVHRDTNILQRDCC